MPYLTYTIIRMIAGRGDGPPYKNGQILGEFTGPVPRKGDFIHWMDDTVDPDATGIYAVQAVIWRLDTEKATTHPVVKVVKV
jgi:hypothetical protein